jgi:DNA (cytosine-5)-methyltransferase 1
MVGKEISHPFPTITARGTQNQLLTAFLVRHFGQSVGQSVGKPCPTVMSDGLGKTGMVAAHLTKFNGKSDSADPSKPIPTITGKNKAGVVTSHLIKLRGTCRHGQDVRIPMPTVTAGGLHIGEVRAFLVKYYGTAIGQSLKKPLHSVTSKARFGLVTIAGEEYQIADIGMRMLSPRELFRAQGFHDDYIIDPIYNGKPLTKTAQVRMCGNSVSPNAAEAIINANAGIISDKVAVA